MSRRIVTTQLQAVGKAVEVDTYSDKLIKYIPADIVGAWIAVKGLVAGGAETLPKATILWIAFIVGAILAFLWTLRQTRDPDRRPAITQTVIATIAFVVWVIATGQPFELNPVYGSLILIAYTLVVPLVSPPES
jgi:hypothetical protein